MKKNQVALFAALALVVGVALLGLADQALAFGTVDTNGTGYELYELIVNDFIAGPLGTAAGVVLVVVGAIGAAMGKLSAAAWPLVGGGALALAPTLAESLGMIF